MRQAELPPLQALSGSELSSAGDKCTVTVTPTVVMATHSAECAAMADEVDYLVDGLRIEVEIGRSPVALQRNALRLNCISNN